MFLDVLKTLNERSCASWRDKRTSINKTESCCESSHTCKVQL